MKRQRITDFGEAVQPSFFSYFFVEAFDVNAKRKKRADMVPAELKRGGNPNPAGMFADQARTRRKTGDRKRDTRYHRYDQRQQHQSQATHLLPVLVEGRARLPETVQYQAGAQGGHVRDHGVRRGRRAGRSRCPLDLLPHVRGNLFVLFIGRSWMERKGVREEWGEAS